MSTPVALNPFKHQDLERIRDFVIDCAISRPDIKHIILRASPPFAVPLLALGAGTREAKFRGCQSDPGFGKGRNRHPDDLQALAQARHSDDSNPTQSCNLSSILLYTTRTKELRSKIPKKFDSSGTPRWNPTAAMAALPSLAMARGVPGLCQGIRS